MECLKWGILAYVLLGVVVSTAMYLSCKSTPITRKFGEKKGTS